MSWVTFFWSMSAGLCLALGGIHLLTWSQERAAGPNLVFALTALAAAALAILELFVMRSQTPGEFEVLLRWMHVPTAIIVVGIVWFIRFYLGTGRVWLAWCVTGLRGVILLIDFSAFPNATFQEVHALREAVFLGEILSAPIGQENPWRFLIHMSTALLLIYVLDAALAAWKLGKRRQALVIGSAIVLAVVLAKVFSSLMVHGVLPGPLIALVFLLIVSAMAFEMSVELIRAKQLSRDLQESEGRMRLAARAAELGFWDWDVKRDEIWVDDVVRERIGTSTETRLLNRESYMSTIRPEDRYRLRQALDHALVDDKDFAAEFRLVDQGSGEHWIAVSGRIERDAEGEPLRLRGISMDITARKQFQDEAQKHRAALSHTQRFVAMGQLSAALAHELNQPLGAILRNAEAGELFLRQDRPDLDELSEIFVDIQRDNHRAAQVIDRMRALLRHRELRFEVIVLDELIRQVAALLSSEVQARNAELHITIPTKLPELRGDRVHLQQVMVNLLLNSLDALDAGTTDVRRIDIGAVQIEGGLVEVAVKDTGIGIDPGRLQDAFELFTTTKSEGIGIGLAISKTIVEAHGGQIRAENSPGGGACIRFTLPVTRMGEAA